MAEPRQDPVGGPAQNTSKLLILIMLVVVIGSIAAFLILKPNPSNAPSQNPAAPPSAQH